MQQDPDGTIWAFMPGTGPKIITPEQADMIAQGEGCVGKPRQIGIDFAGHGRNGRDHAGDPENL